MAVYLRSVPYSIYIMDPINQVQGIDGNGISLYSFIQWRTIEATFLGLSLARFLTPSSISSLSRFSTLAEEPSVVEGRLVAFLFSTGFLGSVL